MPKTIPAASDDLPLETGRSSTADAVGVARSVEERDIQSPPGMPGQSDDPSW